MSALLRLAALAAAVALSGCTTSNTCSIARVTDLPLDLEQDHLVTSVTIDGSPARMMVDTGAFETVLTGESVARLHLRDPEWTGVEAQGIGGTRRLSDLRTARFKLGDMHGEDLHFGVLVGKHVMGDLRIDGIVGMDLLSQVDVDVDWPGHKLILYRPVAGCDRPSAVLDPPLYILPMVQPIDERSPMVEVSIAGKRLIALLDSGSEGNLMYRRTARRIGLDEAALAGDSTGTTGGIGPRKVKTWQHVAAAVTIGDLTIRNMPVEILDERNGGPDDIILGLDFFARVHVWISFSSRTVIMQFPSQPSPAAPRSE